MIPTLMNHASVPTPVDQTVIKTSFRLKEVPGDYLPDQLHMLPHDMRDHIRSTTANAKSDHTHHTRPKDKPPQYDPRIPTRVIHVDGFGVVKLHAEKFPGQG